MHIHILGICGTFMGSLAQLAKAQGHRVTGSDRFFQLVSQRQEAAKRSQQRRHRQGNPAAIKSFDNKCSGHTTGGDEENRLVKGRNRRTSLDDATDGDSGDQQYQSNQTQ